MVLGALVALVTLSRLACLPNPPTEVLGLLQGQVYRLWCIRIQRMHCTVRFRYLSTARRLVDPSHCTIGIGFVHRVHR